MRNLAALAVLLLATLCAHSQPEQPTFAALDMTGAKVDMADLRGKVVVLNLWFINCANCVGEIKLLNALVDEYKDNKEVEFLAPAASNKPELEKFLAKHPFKYQVIPNAMMLIMGKFGTPDKKGEINIPFPMHYVLDREGKIIVKAQGIKGIDSVRAELQKQFAASQLP
jgi:peroxiredoxin